jgi:hypothetical protein
MRLAVVHKPLLRSEEYQGFKKTSSSRTLTTEVMELGQTIVFTALPAQLHRNHANYRKHYSDDERLKPPHPSLTLSPSSTDPLPIPVWMLPGNVPVLEDSPWSLMWRTDTARVWGGRQHPRPLAFHLCYMAYGVQLDAGEGQMPLYVR